MILFLFVFDNNSKLFAKTNDRGTESNGKEFEMCVTWKMDANALGINGKPITDIKFITNKCAYFLRFVIDYTHNRMYNCHKC